MNLILNSTKLIYHLHFAEKVIFLVTSGIYSDQEVDVMRTIIEGNRKFSFKVVLSVFAIHRKFSDFFYPENAYLNSCIDHFGVRSAIMQSNFWIAS